MSDQVNTNVLAIFKDCSLGQIEKGNDILAQVLAQMQPKDDNNQVYHLPIKIELEIDELSYLDACSLSVALRSIIKSSFKD
jgi:hypothetical protein